MKFKLKNGAQIQLHDEDMEKIYQMWKQHGDEFDFDAIRKKLSEVNPKLILIQRSRGYSARQALSIEKIEEAAKKFKYTPSTRNSYI